MLDLLVGILGTTAVIAIFYASFSIFLEMEKQKDRERKD